MKLLLPGGLLQWFDGKVLFCNPEAGSKLCAEIQCSIPGVGVSGYVVLTPCSALNVNISGVVDAAPLGCENCTDLNGNWEVAEDIVCGYWRDFYPNAIIGNCSLVSLFFAIETRVCCDTATNEIVLYMFCSVIFGSSGVVIEKELDRQPIVDGKCYEYDWSNPNEVFTCGTPDVSCSGTITFCDDSGNCDFSSAIITLTAA